MEELCDTGASYVLFSRKELFEFLIRDRGSSVILKQIEDLSHLLIEECSRFLLKERGAASCLVAR